MGRLYLPVDVYDEMVGVLNHSLLCCSTEIFAEAVIIPALTSIVRIDAKGPLHRVHELLVVFDGERVESLQMRLFFLASFACLCYDRMQK